jgi:hypothetical protein
MLNAKMESGDCVAGSGAGWIGCSFVFVFMVVLCVLQAAMKSLRIAFVPLWEWRRRGGAFTCSRFLRRSADLVKNFAQVASRRWVGKVLNGCLADCVANMERYMDVVNSFLTQRRKSANTQRREGILDGQDRRDFRNESVALNGARNFIPRAIRHGRILGA